MLKSKPEIELQKAVHNVLSDPSVVRHTTNEKRLQILSPGRLNVHSGPDFLETAILLDGNIIVGDCEFHKCSSDWISHGHSKDRNYDSVILHVVLEDNAGSKLDFDTLIMNKIEIRSELEKGKQKKDLDIKSIHDLQDYSLVRILRKTSDIKRILEYSEYNDALRLVTSKFIERYNNRRRRPLYSNEQLKVLIAKISESKISDFLIKIKEQEEIDVLNFIPELLREKIDDEGKNLRLEILLNCIIPFALCLANEETRISLFLWYWSTPALNQYGILKRRFESIPQNYIWQQQGLLEYMKEHGNKQNIVSEVVKTYGFAEVLSFYRVGRAAID